MKKARRANRRARMSGRGGRPWEKFGDQSYVRQTRRVPITSP